MSSSGPLRIGILGAARIARSFVEAVRPSAKVVVTAGAGRDTGADFPPLVDVRRGTGWDAARELIETEALAAFLPEAETLYDLVRFGWAGWTDATPAESIDIARTLDAIAASSRHRAPVDVADKRGN